MFNTNVTVPKPHFVALKKHTIASELNFRVDLNKKGGIVTCKVEVRGEE